MAGLGYLSRRLPRPRAAGTRLLGAAIVVCGAWTAVVPLATLAGYAAHAHHHVMEDSSRAAPSGGRATGG